MTHRLQRLQHGRLVERIQRRCDGAACHRLVCRGGHGGASNRQPPGRLLPLNSYDRLLQTPTRLHPTSALLGQMCCCRHPSVTRQGVTADLNLAVGEVLPAGRAGLEKFAPPSQPPQSCARLLVSSARGDGKRAAFVWSLARRWQFAKDVRRVQRRTSGGWHRCHVSDIHNPALAAAAAVDR